MKIKNSKLKILTVFIKKYSIEILLVVFALSFSFWLMFLTFSYRDGSMLIAGKAWSDFASHIPLIRSFSLGDNFPPEYPLFPGEPIRYHFLFYAIVGLIEKAGIRIDYALNIPSALSFAALIITIYFFAKFLFKSRAVGILSVLFFLFNSSFSFIYFFLKNGFRFSDVLIKIFQNQVFPAFNPYDGTLISGGFWNLNVFTNQRHFAFPLALLLFIFFIFLRYETALKKVPAKLSIVFGLLIGGLSILHGAGFVMGMALLFSMFILFPRQRKSLFTAGVVSIISSAPRIFFLWQVESASIFKINPGYLVSGDLSLFNWLRYWILNLGVGIVLLPLGLKLARPIARKIFIAFSILFIIGNIFQFSPDIATNHKFFNLWVIVANMFIALTIIRLFKNNVLQKIFALILVALLTLSGLIDFFPIKNDNLYTVPDATKNKDIKWIIENTNKKSIFLNSTYLYHPASIAGRKVFMGWPYFSWSLGYDTYGRDTFMKYLFSIEQKSSLCDSLKSNHIGYITLQTSGNEFPTDKSRFDKDFKIDYQNNENGFTIYNVKSTCK